MISSAHRHNHPAYSEADVIRVLNKIRELKARSAIKQREPLAYINRKAEVLSEPRWSETLKVPEAHWQRIDRPAYDALCSFLVDHFDRVQEDPREMVTAQAHHHFYSLLAECNSGGLEAEARERLPGNYLIYRPSVMLQGHVVIGFCQIRYDPKTNALSFTEQIRHRDAGETDTRESEADKRHFLWTGYLINTPTKYFGWQIDEGNGFPRTTILDEIYQQDGLATQLMGITSGILGPSIYSGPVYLTRWHEGEASWEDMHDAPLATDPARKLIDVHPIELIQPIARAALDNRLGNVLPLWGQAG